MRTTVKYIIIPTIVVATILIAGLELRHLRSRDLTGTWKTQVEWSNGSPGTPIFTLEQRGSDVVGTYAGIVGEFPVNGTMKERAVRFEIQFTEDFKTRRPELQYMRFTGSLDWTGGKLLGTVETADATGEVVGYRN